MATERTATGWGLQLLKRWPALSLIPLLSLIVFLLISGLDRDSISSLIPFALVATTPVQAGLLHALAEGLQGQPVTWSRFIDGAKQNSLRLLAIRLPVAVIAAYIPVVNTFPWLLPPLILPLEIRASLRGTSRELPTPLVPVGLCLLWTALANLILTGVNWWSLPATLLFYPWPATLFIAGSVAGFIYGRPLSIAEPVGHWASKLRTTLATLAFSALGWAFITGLIYHLPTFLPGHQPVFVQYGYRYRALDPLRDPARNLPQIPTAKLYVDALKILDRGGYGRGRLINEGQPTLYFTFTLDRRAAFPISKTFFPKIGWSGHEAESRYMLSIEGDVFIIAEWMPWHTQPSINQHAVWGMHNQWGYYFAPQIPNTKDLLDLLLKEPS